MENEHAPIPTDRDILELIWLQKQFDDLLVLQGVTKQQMVGANKFNKVLIEQRDILAHDIEQLQPVLQKKGRAMIQHIEKKYGIEIWFARTKKEEPQKPMIILPNDQKE